MQEFLDMTIEEQLNTFFADTFSPHTHHSKCMTFDKIMECYEQWCHATGCPPLAGQYKMGRALQKTYFHKSIHNKKFWFCEIRKDLLADVEELENGLSGP